MPPAKFLIDFLALINTILPWCAVFLALTRPEKVNEEFIIASSTVTVLFVFLVERGYRHMDFKASLKGGLDFHGDSYDAPEPPLEH